MPELTPEQIKAVTRHILRSWKFWSLLVLVVAAAGLGVVALAERIIDLRSAEYINSLQQKAAGQFATINGQISNQIVSEFYQPRIQAMVDRVAREKAAEMLTNAVAPSLDAFQLAVEQARSQLSRYSNQFALLDLQKQEAGKKNSNSAVTPHPAQPSAAGASPKLVLVDHSVSTHGNNYVLSLNLKKPGGGTIGPVDLVAGTYKQTAKILNFASLPLDQTASPVSNAEGDAAELSYFAPGDETTVLIEFSGPTIVRISGDALEGDLTLPVAADKIHLSPASVGQ